MSEENAIVYPPGCSPISLNMDLFTLTQRLKIIAKSFHGMKDESDASLNILDFRNLGLFLTSSFFTSHESDDVRLLSAYSVAQFLRRCEKEIPFSSSKLTQVVEFLFSQLSALKSGILQKRTVCEKLLEQLITENFLHFYRMTIDLHGPLISLFNLILNTNQITSSIVIQGLLDKLVGILLHELAQIPDEIIKMIFFGLKDKIKFTNRAAYEITVRLIQKQKDILAPAIGKLLVRELFGTFSCERSYGSPIDAKPNSLPTHWMSRLWKLHSICAEVAMPVMLRLESALTTPNVDHLITLVRFLARLFSTHTHIPAHTAYPSLWRAFLARFSDQSLRVRMVCLQQVRLLFGMKEVRDDLLWTLSKREQDPSYKIRISLIQELTHIMKTYPSIVTLDVEDIFSIVERMRLDIEITVRVAALEKMGEIFSFFQDIQRGESQGDYSHALKMVKEYPKLILLNFWIKPPFWMEDRLCVLDQLHAHLLPVRMERKERMQRLLEMWISWESHICKTFIEITFLQSQIRENLLDVIKCLTESKVVHSKEERHAILSALAIAPHLPLGDALHTVISFAVRVRRNEQSFRAAETILLSTSCNETMEAMNTLLDVFKLPLGMRVLLDFAADLLMDKDSLIVIIKTLNDILQGNMACNYMNVDIHTAKGKIFHLLQGICHSNPRYFFDEEAMLVLTCWLQYPDIDLQINTLKLMSNLKPREILLREAFPQAIQELINVCEKSCSDLNTRLAKWVIRSVKTLGVDIEILRPIFLQVFETFSILLPSEELLTAYKCIVFIGYISYHFGKYFEEEIKNLLSKESISAVMTLSVDITVENAGWNCFEFLPLEICTKIKFIKLLGQILSSINSEQTTRVLSTLFEIIGGEGLNPGVQVSDREKAWLKQAAACSVLKYLIGRKLNALTCNQYYQLAALMRDEEPFVRERFIRKFTAKMMLDYPYKSLPLGLLGFYMLIDECDSDSIAEMNILFSRRLRTYENFKSTTLDPGNFEIDDHILVYGLLLTANSKHFHNCQSFEQLNGIKKQMLIFMNAMSTVWDDFLFYQKQIKLLKNHAIEGADKDTNLKLWTVCDLAVVIAKAKTNRDQMTSKEEPTLPTRFFTPLPKRNNQKYLKKSMLAQLRPVRESKGESDSESLESREREEEVEVVGDGEMTMDDDDSIGKSRRMDNSVFHKEEVPTKRKRRAGRLKRRARE